LALLAENSAHGIGSRLQQIHEPKREQMALLQVESSEGDETGGRR